MVPQLRFIFLYSCFFFTANLAFAQHIYPKDYFRNPLDIPMELAGTFGELRTAHFHSGIDLKTKQREGLEVHTAAKGYVSRIKISNWGYGKAIYIDHPNGYTTVYAHLKKFSPKIEAYIKKRQYAEEKNQIQVFPKKRALKITKDEVIAYSGSTGGFIAPHLHFEIRNTRTEKIINPMHFGMLVPDSKCPIINHLRAYTLSDSSHVNRSNIDMPLKIRKKADGKYIADLVQAHGDIGFGINTFDRQDGGSNKNGIYQLEMWVNGKKYYGHKVETFAFNESKYINLLIDYPYYATRKRKYQKLFKHSESFLSLYDKNLNNGAISILDHKNYEVKIVVSDFTGNKTELLIPIKGYKTTIKTPSKLQKTPYYIDYQKANTFKKGPITLNFAANTFYDNIYLNFDYKDSIASIHKPSVPLHKSYTLSFDTKNIPETIKDKMYIGKGKYNDYCNTQKNDSVFKTYTRNLGTFKLCTDTIKPIIKSCSFYENQNITAAKYIRIKTIDKGSGIKTYRGEIDGKWVLLEFNVKNNILQHNLDIKKLRRGKHLFSLQSEDNVGNTCTFTRSFYLK